MAIDLEREEECLTNNLQRQLRQIGIEKEETEAEVENLKRQLEDMRTEREKVSSFLLLTYTPKPNKPMTQINCRHDESRRIPFTMTIRDLF